MWSLSWQISIDFFFFFFTISWVANLISATSVYDFFSFLIKLRTFTFLLKGSTLQLLLADENGQHHYPSTLWSLLRKGRVT